MSISGQQLWYLNKMGVSTWELRTTPRSKAEPNLASRTEQSALPAQKALNPTSHSLHDDHANWLTLEQDVNACVACDLHQTRSQVVFGVGNRQADCLIIGEAPGADEDRLGEPFVGPAGKLLNRMLFAIGLHREDVFITNMIKCRPSNNRDPQLDEITKCEPFLHRQVSLIKPKLIVALGRIAAHNVLKTDQSLASLRGKLSYFGTTKIPVIVTYHPAYLLRSPSEKRKSWQDLQTIQSLLSGSK